MAETKTVYITQEQRDLILKVFGVDPSRYERLEAENTKLRDAIRRISASSDATYRRKLALAALSQDQSHDR